MTSEHWICVQTGDKGYYQFPRMLNLEGRLHALVTDFWCPPWLSGVARRLPSRTAQAMAGRFHQDLANVKVKSFNCQFILLRLRQKWLERVSGGLSFRKLVAEENRWFVAKAVPALEKLSKNATISLFTHSGIGLETFSWAKKRGIYCVLHQIHPGATEDAIRRDEVARWPGWSTEPQLDIPPEVLERRKREWELADKILVNSEWSRKCLVDQGVPTSKMVVVSLAYEGKIEESNVPVSKDHVTRVLWLGDVCLRKGIQYLIEAAKLLTDEKVTFDVAGQILITSIALSQAPSNMRFLGKVTATQRAALYRSADIFVLPTLSDGFAMTQLEAMSHGLPVIATPNCGQVVRHGENGLIVPPRDSRALANAIALIAQNPELRETMSRKARGTVKEFSIRAVAPRLCAALDA